MVARSVHVGGKGWRLAAVLFVLVVGISAVSVPTASASDQYSPPRGGVVPVTHPPDDPRNNSTTLVIDDGEYNVSKLPDSLGHINKSWDPPRGVADKLTAARSPNGSDVPFGRFSGLWSLDDDLDYPRPNRSTENMTPSQLRAFEGDMLWSDPPSMPVVWNQLNIQMTPQIGQEKYRFWFTNVTLPDAITSVTPPNGTNTTDGELIKDAHITIHSFSPHTYLHPSENITKKYIAPKSSANIFWDNRIHIPEPPEDVAIQQLRACRNQLTNISIYKGDTVIANATRTISHGLSLKPGSARFGINASSYNDTTYRNFTMGNGTIGVNGTFKTNVRGIEISGQRLYQKRINYFNETQLVDADEAPTYATPWKQTTDVSARGSPTKTTLTYQSTGLMSELEDAPDTDVILTEYAKQEDEYKRVPVGAVPCNMSTKVAMNATIGDYTKTKIYTRLVNISDNTYRSSRGGMTRVMRVTKVVDWNITAKAEADFKWYNETLNVSTEAPGWTVPNLSAKVRGVRNSRGEATAILLRNSTSGPIDRLEVTGLQSPGDSTLQGIWQYYTVRDTNWDQIQANSTEGTIPIRDSSRAFTKDTLFRPVEVHAFPSKEQEPFHHDVLRPTPDMSNDIQQRIKGQWMTGPERPDNITAPFIQYGYAEPKALSGTVLMEGDETPTGFVYAPVHGYRKYLGNTVIKMKREPRMVTEIVRLGKDKIKVYITVTDKYGSPIRTEEPPRKDAYVSIAGNKVETGPLGRANTTIEYTPNVRIPITYVPPEEGAITVQMLVTSKGKFNAHTFYEETRVYAQTEGENTLTVPNLIWGTIQLLIPLIPLLIVLRIYEMIFDTVIIPRP